MEIKQILFFVILNSETFIEKAAVSRSNQSVTEQKTARSLLLQGTIVLPPNKYMRSRQWRRKSDQTAHEWKKAAGFSVWLCPVYLTGTCMIQ